MRHFPHHHRPLNWQHTRRQVTRRFILFFGTLVLLFLAALGVVTLLGHSPVRMEHLQARGVLIFCGIPLIFLLLSSFLGMRGFRTMGTPLIEVISAAEAVARGDLSVRVREDFPGEFGVLGRSFNQMAAELERGEQQRRNLTADVAHELRTPLHILQGNLEGMLDGVYSPSPEKLSAILEETRHLARLVNDLQTLTLAESGQLQLHATSVPVKDLLEDACSSFSGQAGEAGVALVVDLPGGEQGLTIQADPDRMDQVLSNLVVNALRHTPPGGEIRLSAEGMQDGACLQVADTGEGIPPDELPYIFDRFWRGDKARGRDQGEGSGLGLAIARQLVRAHGGTIEVSSIPGKGTTFRIQLPQKSPGSVGK